MDTETSYFGRDLEAMSFAKNYSNWILEKISPFLGRVSAEVGAGTGNFSILLSKKLDTLFTLEPSENMFPILKDTISSLSNIKTENSFLSQQTSFSEEHLDSIVYINVLEHIENDLDELLLMKKHLKVGGHALIFVPALPFLYSEFDKSLGHFRRYTKDSLTKQIEKSGLKISSIKYFDIAGILPWYIAFTLLKKNMSGSNVSLYDSLVIPPMKVIENIFNPPIGKNLLAIAKKTI
jgi:SAM-dependent methyltransferase